MRYRCLAGMLLGLAACARADSAVQAATAASAPVATVPVVTTDVASLSFRGLRIAVGETSPGRDIVIRSTGALPLIQLTAAAHGDFTVTKTTCPATLASTPTEQANCLVSIVFKPTEAGLRTGDLTISAAGIKPSVVTLDGGTPVEFPTQQQGTTAVQWVDLPPGTAAVSGSVTGPFAIALQPSYAYGTIAGVAFAAFASTTGKCVSVGTATCSVFLGIEQLATAPLGQSTGTVTLSNGQTYSVTTNVLAGGVFVGATHVNAGDIPVGSTGDVNPITITNGQSAALALGKVQITGPYSAANDCPGSLATGASCSINVYFSPQATGAAAGQLQVATSAGDIVVPLEGIGITDPADVKFSPASLLFALGPTGNSAARTITLTNESATKSVQVGALTGYLACRGNNDQSECLQVLSNNCAVLAPLSSCQIDLVYEGIPGQGPNAFYFSVPLTASGSGLVDYMFPYTEEDPQQFQPYQSIALSVAPSALSFPPTPFGHVSAPQFVTVKNISTTTLTVTSLIPSDFIAEPSCGPLLPGAECNFSVRFFPNSGTQPGLSEGGSAITFAPMNFAFPDESYSLGGASISVSGFSVSPAALASPAYPPLVQPVDVSSQSLTVTNTSATPLILTNVTSSLLTVDASNCVAPLAPGESCSLTPYGAGCAPASGCNVIVNSNAASSPDTYLVTGEQGDSISQLEQLRVPTIPYVFAPTVVGSTSTATLGATLVTLSTEAPISIVITSDLDGSFTTSNNCPSIFQPISGRVPVQTCQIFVAFTPPSPGFFSGTLTSTSNVGKWTAAIAGYGVPAAPLVISPSSVLLSAVVGQTDDKTVTLKNTSTQALTLAAPGLAGPQASSFSIGGSTCGSSLAAGASCTIDIVYTKPDYESLATLIITSENTVIQTVPLTGGIPQLSVSEPTLPGVYVGSSSDVVFTLQSSFGGPITVESVSLSSYNVSSFKIASSTCVPNVTLSGAKTCVIDLTLMPQSPGALSTLLTITSTAGSDAFFLQFAGYPAPAQVSPTALAFGNEALGSTGAAQSITISNPNPSAVTLPGLQPVSGANAGDFKVAGNCTAIAANASCQLMVSFSPSAAGARSAALVIGTGTTTDPNTRVPVVNSTTVQFTGTGDLVVATCAELQLIKAAFGSKRGQPTYNPAADVNDDGVINIIDLSVVARALPPGTTCK